MLLSSYGSSSRRLLDPNALYFWPNQRVGIERSNPDTGLCLLFSRAEFDEVVARVCDSYGHEQGFRPSAEVVNYVWELTNGRPSGVYEALTDLAETSVNISLSIDSVRVPLSCADSTQVSQRIPQRISRDPTRRCRGLLRDHFRLQMIMTPKFGRGLPPVDFLQVNPEAVDFLQEAVVLTHIKGTSPARLPLGNLL